MKLELFCRTTCPYCVKVLNFMEKNDIQGVEIKEISINNEFEKELIMIGGKRQVPCLVIDGMAMYESDDIIQWLREHNR